eukprot:scaffold58_cov256-Pinguiococcus_pyrenoidosus.AAC.26
MVAGERHSRQETRQAPGYVTGAANANVAARVSASGPPLRTPDHTGLRFPDLAEVRLLSYGFFAGLSPVIVEYFHWFRFKLFPNGSK